MNTDELLVARLGLVPYGAARELQDALEGARQDSVIPDVLLLLEHPPVYTRGRRSTPDELPMGVDWYRSQGIEIADTDRGGRVTYHGPGQLVGYPIMSLRPYGLDVHDYVRRLERVMIASLATWNVAAQTIEGLTGVWTEGERPGDGGAPGEARKIGSIGVHVSRGVTTHGFAINVNNDLQPFEWIVPCGIEGCRVTSLGSELSQQQDMSAFMDTIRDRFGWEYDRQAVEIEADELLRRLENPPPAPWAEAPTALR